MRVTNEGVWKTDSPTNTDTPGPYTIVTHSTDECVEQYGVYTLGVRHCIGLAGKYRKGFMAFYYMGSFNRANCQNCEFHPGTDQATYDKVVAQGRQKMIEKWEKIEANLR